MLFLLLIFVLTGMALTVLLWIGTVFLQGYFYTEPTSGIGWQAPAAGFSLGLFLTLWCWVVVSSTVTNPQEIPYDTLFRFKPRDDMYKDPVKEFWVVKKGVAEPIHYKMVKKFVGGQTRIFYVTNNSGQPYSPNGVEAILLREDGAKVRFNPVPGPVGSDYRDFVDDQGWSMREYENGPTGQPEIFRWGRFLGNIFLNLFHLGLWFACLWLILRFQWAHALGLAIALWLVMSLMILPLILEQAGIVASKNTLANSPRAAMQRLGSTRSMVF